MTVSALCREVDFYCWYLAPRLTARSVRWNGRTPHGQVRHGDKRDYERGETPELLTQRLDDQSSAHVFDRFGFPSIELVRQLGDAKYRSYAVFADVSVPLGGCVTFNDAGQPALQERLLPDVRR